MNHVYDHMAILSWSLSFKLTVLKVYLFMRACVISIPFKLCQVCLTLSIGSAVNYLALRRLSDSCLTPSAHLCAVAPLHGSSSWLGRSAYLSRNACRSIASQRLFMSPLSSCGKSHGAVDDLMSWLSLHSDHDVP